MKETQRTKLKNIHHINTKLQPLFLRFRGDNIKHCKKNKSSLFKMKNIEDGCPSYSIKKLSFFLFFIYLLLWEMTLTLILFHLKSYFCVLPYHMLLMLL